MEWKYYVCYLEQSALREIGMETEMPQLAGRAWANWALTEMLLEADLRQLQAAFLSSEVEAADANALAPEQHAAGGFPLPLDR